MNEHGTIFAKHKRSEILLLLVIGVMVGLVVKWNVDSFVTIGYEDYLVPQNVQAYDFKEINERLTQEAQAQGSQGTVPTVGGAACGV